MIKLLILDVDGVLTTGELPYDADGSHQKSFFVQDGGAIRLWQAQGGLVAILSGRNAPAVRTRAEDLDIATVVQGVPDKVPAYETICRELGAAESGTAVMGDDLPDLPLMRRCGFPIAVANAHRYVKRSARYVTRRSGGHGAVAEGIEQLLRHNGAWPDAVARFRSSAGAAAS